VTGLPYDAADPDLLLWVHAALVDSVVRVAERYGRPLEPGDADRYVAEMVPFAAIVGVPAVRVPTTVAGLDAYLRSVELVQATPAARDAIGYVLDPPDVEGETRETWRELGEVAIGTLPEWARSLYGFAAPPAGALERLRVRQLLGVLDLGFESLPGVLEARQRIELRVRARHGDDPKGTSGPDRGGGPAGAARRRPVRGAVAVAGVRVGRAPPGAAP
jgi:uncharacterized protein (DUF2236 family)